MAYSPDRNVSLSATGYSPTRDPAFASGTGISGSINGLLPSVSGGLSSDSTWEIYGGVNGLLPVLDGQLLSNDFDGIYGDISGFAPSITGTMLGGERTGVVINPAGAGSYSPSRGITLSVTPYSPLRNPDFEPTGAPPVYGLPPQVTGHIEVGIYAGIYGDLTGLLPSTNGLVKTNEFEGVYGDLIGLLPQVDGLIEGANQISGALSGMIPELVGYVGDHSPKEIPFSFARSFDGIQILSNSLKYTAVISNGVDDDIAVPIESMSINDRYYNNSRTMLVTLLTPADLSESLIGRQTGDALIVSKVLGVVSKSIFEGSITNAIAVNYKYQLYAKQSNKPVDAVNVVVDKLLYTNKTGLESRYRMPINLNITPLSTLTIEGREVIPSAVTSYISLKNSFMEVSGG